MRRLFLFLFLNLLTIAGFSQNLERYNWYFGNSTQSIRFNRTSAQPSVVTKAIPFGTGGGATASDPANANLLFYTDGANVYDSRHGLMPNGTGLTANTSANQPTAICPVPGQLKKYFIFTNTANFPAPGSISVSVVDMNLFGNSVFPEPALGDLEGWPVAGSKNVPIAGLVNRAEAMIIVPDILGINFYLVTQLINSDSYSVTVINPASYTSGTFNTSTLSGLAQGIPLTAANFSFHPGKNKIAVSPQDTNTDAIILDINPASGVLNFDRFIFNSGLPTLTNQSIYDIEWSMTGDFLYLSRFGEAGVVADLLQYDYLNPLSTLASVLPSSVFRSYGVQMAPDSSIYHLYQASAGGPFLVGRMAKPDTIASEVKYTPAVLSPATFGATQFPSFAGRTQVTLTVDFTSTGTCENNKTTFFPNIIPAADSVRWDFGDMTGSTSWSPVHLYGAPQSYNVTLTAFFQNQTQAISKPITIQPFPLKLDLVQDTTACRPEFPPKRGSSSPTQFSVTVKVTGATPTSYIWSNGDIGPTLKPDSAGYYYVVVSDGSGCSAYAGVNVKEYRLQDQRSNIWYFGNKAGIDFNRAPPVPLANSSMDAPEGCAIICDRNGKTIFYTDGTNVYDKTDALIATAIGGDPLASQSSIIVPVPGDETLYYIFTNEAVNGGSGNVVRYSLFDLKLNGGLGDVVEQNLTLFSRSTERMTASGQWLIIHEFGNNTFRAYPISQAGIGAPVLTAIGSDHLTSPVENSEGYMKLGPRNTLAVTLSTPGISNLVELFQLTDSTGKLSNYRKINLKEAQGQVYGLEFSPGGNKIFTTVKGSLGSSHLFEYFIDSIGAPYFRQKITQAAELGAIQQGPDGRLYVAVNGVGNDFLGTIQAVDDTTQFSSFTLKGFALAGLTNSRLGLPNFIQQISNATGGPGIEVSGVCLGSPTKFIGTPTDAIDHFFWRFGDGGNAGDSSTVEHTYALPNTYQVSLRLTNRCQLDTVMTKNVTIVKPPALPTIPGAALLCNGPVTLDANTGNIPGLTYLWAGGATTQSIVVSDQSIQSVTIADANGCTSAGTSLVADNRPQLDLGPDQTLCQNSFTLALNALNPGATYAWTVNGGSLTTSQSRALDTTLPGMFNYQVVVTDASTPFNCSITEQVVYTIVASPSFTLSGTNPSACLGTNGILTVQLSTTVPSTGPYSYFITGPGSFSEQGIDQSAPATLTYTSPLFSVPAGTYSGVVTDQISGCTISQSFGLSDATWTASAAATSCDPADVTISTAGVFVGSLQYTYRSPTHPTQGPFAVNTASLLSGDWVVEVRDNNGAGCTFAFNLNVPPATQSVAVVPSLCTTPATLTANPSAVATSFAWTGPGITSSPALATININQAGQYSVTAVIGGCPIVQTFQADYDNPVADFAQSDPCQNSVTLMATPSGNYTYRWYRNASATIDAVGQSISLGIADDGVTYQSELFNTLNGCTSPKSPVKTVRVIGLVDAGMTATPACEDGKPFTLTAITTATGVSYAWYRDNSLLTTETSSTSNQTEVGVYKVEVSKASCVTPAQLTIARAPIPIGKLPNQTIICNDKENTDPSTNQVDLDPGVFVQYDWFKNELNINYTQQVLTADSEGKYRVDLTNSFGCIAADEVVVLNDCQPTIDAPNAFRPGSSIDVNKNFFAFTKFITEEFQIFIFNRWGELVYTSSSRDFKWNGGLNNSQSQPVPGGSYSYVIKYVSSFHPERGIQERRGGVALLR